MEWKARAVGIGIFKEGCSTKDGATAFRIKERFSA